MASSGGSGGGGELFDWGGTPRYALAIMRPKSTGLNATDRIYAADPGETYNIGAAVYGGVPPFKYELTSGVPAGMTINVNTGEIIWLNPQADATPTLQVTDSSGAQVTSSWTITVSGSRFKYIAPPASGGSDSNTGTKASPWATLAKFKASAGVNGIGVFRAGTYDMTGLVDQGEGIRWGTTLSSPSIFLGYEGETVTFDFGGGQFDFGDGGSSPRVYLDNLILYGGGNKTLRGFSNDNMVVRRFVADTFGPGTNGSNSGFIMTESDQGPTSPSYSNIVVQDGIVRNMLMAATNGANCFVKMYAWRRGLFERIHIEAMSDGGSEFEAVFSNKAGNQENIVRFCTSDQCVMPLVGGSQNGGANGRLCDWQVVLCHFKGPNSSIGTVKVNEFGTATAPHYYDRCTFEGWVYIDEASTGEGPFNISDCVIVNNNTGDPAGSHVQHGTPYDGSLVVRTNNLAGFAADGYIDANGLLTGQSRTDYLYLRGHEVPTL